MVEPRWCPPQVEQSTKLSVWESQLGVLSPRLEVDRESASLSLELQL